MSEPTWRRSSRCAESTCVEVTLTAETVHVRDSRNPEIRLEVPQAHWADFVAGVKAGEFDLPPC
jgi:hypothetical protein